LVSKGGSEEGNVNNGLGGNNANSGNSGNNNNTVNAGNQSNSVTPPFGSKQVNSDSKSGNFFVWANVDKDEEYRTRIKTSNSKNAVSLSLENGGMNLPGELIR
jgi:hypothetical protein